MSEAPPSPPKQSPLAFWAALVVIVAILPVGYWLVFMRKPAPPVSAPPPIPIVKEDAIELKLAQVQGKVEVRRGNGVWEVASLGVALKPSDSLRTGDGSYALLIGEKAYQVRMEPGTEISVADLTRSLSRILLTGGMATATVDGGMGHLFEVRAKGSDAIARTEAGTFAISNNGAGTVAVAAHAGSVELLGAGKTVIVRAGEQSVVKPGRGPTDPVKIPSKLLLKVAWPTFTKTNRRKLVLAGQSEPGSLIQVAGKVVTSDSDGRFSLPIVLREGKNSLRVESRSVGGATRADAKQVLVKTSRPKLGIDPHLWDRK